MSSEEKCSKFDNLEDAVKTIEDILIKHKNQWIHAEEIAETLNVSLKDLIVHTDDLELTVVNVLYLMKKMKRGIYRKITIGGKTIRMARSYSPKVQNVVFQTQTEFSGIGEALQRLRNIILEKESWMSAREICEILGVSRYKKLIKDEFNSTVGQLLYRLKKEGFLYRKEKFVANGKKDYEIWIAPPGTSEVLDVKAEINIEPNEKDLEHHNLFELLRHKRTEIAIQEQVPAFCVFHDKTLREITSYLPIKENDLYNIKGLGKRKIEKYGSIILDIINNYIDDNDLEIDYVSNISKEKEINTEDIIINCIRHFNNKYGVSYITKILKGSKVHEFLLQDFINSGYYGQLDSLRQKVIEKLIKDLIDQGKVLQSGGLRPTLSVFDAENLSKRTEEFYKEIDEYDQHIPELSEDIEFRTQMENKLQEIFGFQHFHDNQWATIQRLLNKERVLLIEKTGFGKSLCYQFPAKMFYDNGEGLTLVFSPLIALMRDQIHSLNSNNIPAAALNSDQSNSENTAILQRARNGELAILFIAPERLDNEEFQAFIEHVRLAMIVIDEAHCITVWGHDFRPYYKRIINIVKHQPPSFPILALTATATKLVEKDIRHQIGKEFIPIRGNLLRDKLSLWVIKVHSEEEKYLWLAENINKLKGTGIIYTGTQRNTEIFSAWLNHNDINACHYHASIGSENKEKVEKELLKNHRKCIVSTNALGMGIDKPDIRFIIHTQIPASPIHYYQEIGRAGRDAKSAFVILFYSEEDRSLQEYFINNSRAHEKIYQKAINYIKKEPLDEQTLRRCLYLTETHTRLLLSDLIDQKIIREVTYDGRRFYEFDVDSKPLDTEIFQKIQYQRTQELNKIIEYANFKECRMGYLCSYLGDDTFDRCEKCDNCRNEFRQVNLTSEWQEKITAFVEEYTPILETENTEIMINGIASSYYGLSYTGKLIHNCKYEGAGDYPDVLVEKTVKVFYKAFSEKSFDLIVFIPPTESGDLVRNFAAKISNELKIPLSENLKKIRKTEPLKLIKSKYLKEKMLRNAFVYVNPGEIKGKNILIIDDIFDSGVTINEVGKLLKRYQAKLIAPLVIAKTVKGDI